MEPTDDGTLYPFSGPLGDSDFDGLTNLLEWQHGCDPQDWDTDEDGVSDWDEIYVTNTAPSNLDSDGDWMPNDYELSHGLDPNDPSDGLLDADSDTIPNQLEFVFRHLGFDATSFNDPATFLWNADPDGDGISTLVEFTTYHTNPAQPDTDNDGMNDGWEILYGFDPLMDNATDSDTSNNLNADPDQDGLSNGMESQLNTNPLSADTDSDGFTDLAEYQGASNGTNSSSTPSNPAGVPGGSTTSPPPVVSVSFIVGDDSDSHSEKYKLVLEQMDGAPALPRHERINSSYGVAEVVTFKISAGTKYKVTLEHVGTDPNYRQNPRPDYDYTLIPVSSPIKPSPIAVFTEDPQGMLGGHGESSFFYASGKNADLYVAWLSSETVATIPLDRTRVKLGVGEEVNLRIKPDSVPTPVWTLGGTPGTSTFSSPINATLRTLESGIRACNPKVDVSINDIPVVINFDVIEPQGEVATIIAEHSPPAGVQGIGVQFDIVTTPSDVSFSNVEVIEIDKGTSNVGGYFVAYTLPPHAPLNSIASPLKHNPAGWLQLDIDNKWPNGDFAGFKGWPPSSTIGNTSYWETGSYQWDIEVRWRVKLKESQGLGKTLTTRTQIHQIIDNQGTSVETKFSLSSNPRTP